MIKRIIKEEDINIKDTYAIVAVKNVYTNKIIDYLYIDIEDLHFILNGFSIRDNGYTKYIDVYYNHKIQRLHRLILKLNFTNKEVVDHINGNGLDNRKQNLCICDNSSNSLNRRNSRNTYFDKRTNSWAWQIRFRKRTYSRRGYDSEQNAYEQAQQYKLWLLGRSPYPN